MMDSWWDLGEGFGNSGDKPALSDITCAFCGETGHFKVVFHAEKKKPNSNKCMNFDVCKCENCGGFVHVLWSAGQSFGRGLCGVKILPWPLDQKPKPSENWPSGVHRFWIQAHDSINRENWDAANLMARSALQFTVREKKATGKDLKAQIVDLTTQGVLHPLMKDWADEVRLLANESAHPDAPKPVDVSPDDAKDIVRFLDSLLFYLYDVPKEIEDFRTRRKPPASAGTGQTKP